MAQCRFCVTPSPAPHSVSRFWRAAPDSHRDCSNRVSNRKILAREEIGSGDCERSRKKSPLLVREAFGNVRTGAYQSVHFRKRFLLRFGDDLFLPEKRECGPPCVFRAHLPSALSNGGSRATCYRL